MLINFSLIIFIVIAFFFLLLIRFRKNYEKELDENVDIFDINYLVEGIRDTFNNILKANLSELNLNQNETNKREKNKQKLRKALRNCNYGDIGAKAYIKDYIKEILQKKIGVNEENIDKIINFNKPQNLTEQDKFEILLYIYQKKYGLEGFGQLIIDNNLDMFHEDRNYIITKEDINGVFSEKSEPLRFVDKLDIISQRIYQLYKGHGVIDDLRDMRIDGVSAGVSGIPSEYYNQIDNLQGAKLDFSYDSIWIFFRGKTIHLSFLGFGTQKELERVCKNIYRYNNPGQLSEAKGYIANEMKDGSRIIVVRPPFAESWAFFVRKFDSIKKTKIEDLIVDSNNEIPISIMKWIIKGCRVSAITGSQGSGKTTLLMSLIQYINKNYTLRIQELVFELNLRKLYPERNILTFKETGTVSGQEGLDIQKKTDGTVNILGEVATAPVSNWLIQVSQVASLFTMFTHHAKTSKDLVVSMRNSLLQTGGFSNEKIAEEQVAETINFDIHMNKSIDGHRYIERITEIIPTFEKEYSKNLDEATLEYFKRTTDKRTFKTVDIVSYENNRYILKNSISKKSKLEIFKYLSDNEKKSFEDFFDRWRCNSD